MTLDPNEVALLELEQRYAIQLQSGSNLKAADFKDVIRELERRGGFTDANFWPNTRIWIKVNGFIVRVSNRALTENEAREASALVAGGEAFIGRLNSGNDFDCAFDLTVDESSYDCYRYRVNITRARNEFGKGYFANIRAIKSKIPALNYVGITEDMFKEIMARQGLGLITGTTASGKSTTGAALLQHQLDFGKDSRNILSYESPVEYLLNSQHSRFSIASQVEISEYGGDLETMDAGVRNSLRRNGDIVWIGETRDPSTADAAITAAMTGQFCMSTMHTNSVAETVDRFLSFYSDPAILRQKTAEFFNQIRWIISQALVKGAKPEKPVVLVREYMFFDAHDRMVLLSYSGNDRKTFIEKMVRESNKGRLMIDHADELLASGDIDDYIYSYIKSGIS